MSEELTTPTPEEQPKKKRRKRRTKAEIAAEKAAKEAAAAEAAEMEAKGYEKLRHRDEHGHFVKDDPSTPENEAWEWVKKEEPKEEEECVTCNESAAKALEAAEAAISEDPVKEEPVVSAPPSAPEKPKVKDPYADYIPKTGLAKLRSRLSQRQIKDDTSKR